MQRKLSASATVAINAPASRVWEALTVPGIIKQYLFGTEVSTDWKEGGPVIYRGTWQGKAYEDKGTVLKVEPGMRLITTYWSSMSGVPDAPENYHRVEYALSHGNGVTKLTVTQDNIDTEESRKHSERNWMTVLEALKELLEKR